jgi:hypothetical protein
VHSERPLYCLENRCARKGTGGSNPSLSAFACSSEWFGDYRSMRDSGMALSLLHDITIIFQ